MKQLILFFAFLLLCTFSTFAQAPSSFKYQAVARDANSNVIANQVIGLRFSIVEDDMLGNIAYAEVHFPIVSDRGVFSLEVGNGISQTGAMSNVDWANHNYFLRVEMDPQGGNAFQLMGISQLLSVPYAMHAATVDDKDDADADPNNEMQTMTFDPNTNILTLSDGGQADLNTLVSGQSGSDDQNLSLNGTLLIIENGNTIDLSSLQDGVDDADANPSNELQNLSFNSNTNQLTISNGNTITIPSGGTDADADPANELQTISKNGNTVSLSDNGGSFTDETEDADANPSNELQNLSFDSNTNQLTISNGNAVTIPSGGTDADADPSNELQSLAFDPNTNQLSISDGNSITIPSGGTDADPDPSNELQSLSQNGLEVNLSNNGGTINIADNDNDSGNEIQNLSLNGTEIMISNGNSIDLSTVIPPGGTDDQTLNLSGTNLSIESGNAIDLSVLQDGVNDADADPANEIQAISKTGNTITLSNGGGSITDEVDDGDADASNELQSLSLTGTEVAISNGNTIDLAGIIPPGGTDDQTIGLTGTNLSIENGNAIDLSVLQDGVDDADADASNELQSLSLTGTEVAISNGNTIDLASIIPPGGTDDQTLGLAGTNLSIENGNAIDLSVLQDGVDDADADASNELQSLSLTGTEVAISNGNTIDLAGIIPPGGTDDQTLGLTGTNLSIENGNAIDLSVLQDGVDDADADASNELQSLSLTGTEVAISNGNTIDLAGIIPPGGTDDQTLGLTGTNLSIENGNAIDLSVLQDGVDDADADPANEIQAISKTGNTINLSNGGGSITDEVDDADADASNELQNLSLNGTQVVISNGNSIDLGPIIPPGGTDDQTLGLTGTNLSIENGNAIDLSVLQDGVNDADADPVNELQFLSLNGTLLNIDQGNAVDLNVLQDGVDDADADPGNELQILSLNGTILDISGVPSSVDLVAIQDGVNDADADPNNEIQSLSIVGNDLTLSGSNSISLAGTGGLWSSNNSGIHYTGGNIGFGTNDPTYAYQFHNDVFVNSSFGGLYIGDPAANQWQFATANGGADLSLFSGPNGGSMTNRVTFLQDGRIGVGTNAPERELHMKGSDQRIWLDADGTGNNASIMMTTDDAVNTYFKATMNDAVNIATFNDGTSLSQAATLDAGPGAARMAINIENGPMHLMTGGNTRMFLKNDGKTGFGTMSPVYSFQFDDNVFVNTSGGAGSFKLGTPQSNQWELATFSGGAHLSFFSGTDDTNLNERITFRQNGDVGIGTFSPSSELSVGDGIGGGWEYPAVTIGGASDDGAFNGGAIEVGSADYRFSIAAATFLGDARLTSWNGSNINSMRIFTTGLSVGENATAAGNYPLKVVQSGTYGLNVEHNGGTNNWELYVADDGDLRLYSQGSFKGEFSSVNGAYTQASDRQLKTNIQMLSSVLPSVLKLEPSIYKYISNKADDSNSIGFVAQDVQKLFPELVNQVTGDRSENLLSVDYSGFSVLAIKAIQEQQKVIDIQAQKIDDLESRMARLEAAIEKLK